MYYQLILGCVFVLIGASVYYHIINRNIERGNSDWIGYFFGIVSFIFGLFLIIKQIYDFSIYKLVFTYINNK